MSTNKSITKAASIISLGTILSRILGFIRDITIANFFGTSYLAEAFFVAFRIPNLLRNLVGEGSVNAAIVPVFSEYLVNKDKQELFRLVNIVMYFFIVALGLITICGIIFSPLIVKLIAPGFIKDALKFNLTIKLTRIMFPYLILIGLTAYSIGTLHSFKSFVSGAISPCLLNIALIVSAIIGSIKLKEPILGLAIGVIIGGILQLLVQIPPIYKRGFRLKRIFDFSHSGVKKIGSLLLPRIFGSAVYQLNIFIDTICASFAYIVGTGAVAAIYYSNRLIQLPLAVFGIALASAILPTMSNCVAKDNIEELKSILSFSLRKIFLIMIPASVGLIVLSNPIIKVLFQRGQFDSYSTAITSYTLLFYSLGLFAFAAAKILISCFYSLKDTVTPVKVAGICLIINIILNIILMFPLRVGGLALASSISATVNFLLLFYILRKKIGNFFQGSLLIYSLRVCLASVIMGLIIFLIWRSLPGFNDILKLIITICCGFICFIFGCLIFRIKEAKVLVQWILKRN